jgi:hypothetical protein
MKTIETTITVLADGSIQIPPRPDLTPGEHRAVLVVDEAQAGVSPASATTTDAEQAGSDLGRKLRALRAKIVASGAPLLDWDELEEEVAERRGER